MPTKAPVNPHLASALAKLGAASQRLSEEDRDVLIAACHFLRGARRRATAVRGARTRLQERGIADWQNLADVLNGGYLEAARKSGGDVPTATVRAQRISQRLGLNKDTVYNHITSRRRR
jgi:hypothetical protein